MTKRQLAAGLRQVTKGCPMATPEQIARFLQVSPAQVHRVFGEHAVKVGRDRRYPVAAVAAALAHKEAA